MANMDCIQHLVNETKRYSLNIGWTYKVFITHVNNPHSFYVRPREFNHYMSDVQARGEHVNKSDIKVGGIMIYKSKVKKDYVRGKIIFIEGTEEDNTLTCDMFALDIGHIENCVPFRKIWKPLYDVNLPAVAFHCQLANCIPRGERWHESTVEAMRGFVQGKLAKIKVKNVMPGVAIVEVSISAPDDLATLLAITRHTTLGILDDLDFQLNIYCSVANHYSERILQVKSALHIRMLSGSILDSFYAAQVNEYNEYLETLNEYTAYAEKEKSLTIDQLKPNTPVGIFCHNTCKFERGLVKEIKPKKDKAKVELVDWGKMVEESVDKIRPIPERFLANPPLAIHCALHISQYSKSSLSAISNLSNNSYPGLELYIVIEEVADDANSPNLITVFGI